MKNRPLACRHAWPFNPFARRLAAPPHGVAGWFATAFLVAALLPGETLAQPRALTLAPNERIVFDGRLDELAWQRAPLHDRFVQVVAEADALVIGIRAFDPSPAEIRAPLVRRDQDFVAVIIDAVGDRRAAQFVRVQRHGG